MADIVISYARPEWESALTLSASLESEGWSVWLDQGWEDRDPYRAEVTKQLALARAAIVIWSEASIHSDYVLANADRARADGKLISIKQLGLTDADIPHAI